MHMFYCAFFVYLFPLNMNILHHFSAHKTIRHLQYLYIFAVAKHPATSADGQISCHVIRKKAHYICFLIMYCLNE